MVVSLDLSVRASPTLLVIESTTLVMLFASSCEYKKRSFCSR